MYEFHGWFGIAESPEEADTGDLEPRVRELEALLETFTWPTARWQLFNLNGMYYVTVNGLVNRMRFEAGNLDELLSFLADALPGSYGLLYERAPDMPLPAGQDSFRVRVLAKGKVREEVDSLLSPINPTIED